MIQEYSSQYKHHTQASPTHSAELSIQEQGLPDRGEGHVSKRVHVYTSLLSDRRISSRIKFETHFLTKGNSWGY